MPSGNLPSVMSHNFSQVPRADIPRSVFDRSHGYKTTMDAGLLVPIYADEVLPGDTISLNMTAFARLATPIHPIMDNLFVDTFFFFVPNRLLWDNWQRFNGEQTAPGDSTDYLVPQVSTPAGGWTYQSLADYFGLPVYKEIEAVNALHFRAYNLIYNEWFRDENLVDPVPMSTGDGPDDPADYVLRRRGKRHDYFTSALPWPQKGDSVDLPLGQSAPVVGLGAPTFTTGGNPGPLALASVGSEVNFSGELFASADLDWADPMLQADLTGATAATINQLRQAFAVQRLYERDARGGTRYTEILRSHFGVTSPDQRLQRPEYLGGGSQPVSIGSVAQTSSTDTTSPQGNLAAVGTVLIQGHGFSKAFTEHGVVIGLACARADLTYQQGIERMWSRQTRWDFYWPALSHIGEQAVLSKEIFADGTEFDQDVFGYQERYAEYRYGRSKITGLFRSDLAESLDVWHLSQDFATRPVLNSEFILEDPPIDRVIAVPSEPHFIWDSYFRVKAARPMPVFGVPGMIDHF